ncbi:tRNA guanosine-2'-O-methyltransferase [Exidia glandulosa HHB12029]|uniref:tRNA (guanine(10)-N(2))-methyltransferase n=1 Tax=Exidia glandulosa HHB12029 TaxID=1314781 RepID=A0A165F3S5_EXIGL|nr:tRNA guanosine-2'-O-methyltransferase [Exidia glandulosa HHB12029]
MQILVRFAQSHQEFRIPELLSVAQVCGFELKIPDDADATRPFMVLDLPDEHHARLLARRCILIKAVSEFWATGATAEELHVAVKANEAAWRPYEHTSFKFLVGAYNQTISSAEQRARMESLRYMDFDGKIDLKHPELVMEWWEEYDDAGELSGLPRGGGKGLLRQIFFSRAIEDGSARTLVHKFDVKKRAYFGNTSMEAEISLLMANQTLASPGKLMYDPFVGTGSMLYTAAHFGAIVFGSDIDGRQIRGRGTEKKETPGVESAARQYGLAGRLLGCATFDVTRNPWRRGGLFDAIVTDPPYGVRAGAKRLGRKDLTKQRTSPVRLSDGILSHVKPDYIPPTRPYELADLARDLVRFARWALRPGGRLVFFLPTVTDEYAAVDIPTLEGMELVANSCQDFGSWGRRLITMRKVAQDDGERPEFPLEGLPYGGGSNGEEEHVPAHKGFRDKYFAGFKREEKE